MSCGDRKAYAEGDIRSPQTPGGQDRKPQREQTPQQRVKRKQRHLRNKSRNNRDALRRYHTKYKRKRKMKQRREKYQENPERYERKAPRKYERPDKTAVAQRFGRVIEGGSRPVMVWDDEDFEGDPWALALSVGGNVLSNKDFRAGYTVDGVLVAALFDSSDRDGYEFDIVVHPDWQRKRLGSELMDAALDIYEQNSEAYGEDYTLNMDVISPVAQRMLADRGLVEVGREGGHVLMTRLSHQRLKTAVAQRYAARPIPVDKAQLRKVAQGLVDAMVAEARKTGTGSSAAWEFRGLGSYNSRNGVTAQGPSVLIENPLVYGSGFVGKPLTIPVWGVTAKDTGTRSRVPSASYAIWDGRNQWIEVRFNARLSGAKLEDSKTVGDVYSVLLHEVTHATEMVIDRALAEREANPDRPAHNSHRPDYYDIPVEVRAFMQQVADEVETAVRSGVPFRQALKESRSWQRVSPRMNQKNLKKIMKGVYTHIEEQGLPVRTASRLWYHGSPKRFEGFKTYEGHTFGKGPSEVPLFFSPSKSFAKMYAMGPEGTIYAARLKWRKVFDSGDLYRDSRYWPPEYGDLTPEGKALYDDIVDGKVFSGVDEDDLLDGYPSLWAQILRMDYDIIEDASFKRWLKKNGYDAAYVTGDGEQNVFVFSPNQVEIVEVEGRGAKRAGDVMLYDQHNPANNEIKQPGPDVNYRAEGPTTYSTEPDEKKGIVPGGRMPNRQMDDAPPASSRVIPDSMKETLQQNYMKAAAATVPQILSNCGPEVTGRSSDVKYRRKRLSPSGMSTWTAQSVTDPSKSYTVRVKPIRKNKRLKVVAKMPVKASCTCPFWRWQGPEHWAKTNDYLYGKPRGTASVPVIRDPKSKHWACKHVISVLQLVKNYRYASDEGSQWSYDGPIEALPDSGRVAARHLMLTAGIPLHHFLSTGDPEER
mgnify:CR=1 FL=1